MADMGIVSYKKSILPFVVDDIEREGKSFTFDMEVAALICMAEGERKRRGLLGGQSEKISYISKVHYPLWVVPLGDKCLVVDGLGFSTYKDQYSNLPDIKLFTEDLRRSSLSREAFLNTLRVHAETFKDFTSTIDVQLNSVVVGKNLLQGTIEQIKQATTIDEDRGLVTIPLELEGDAALEKCEKSVQHWRQVQADIKGLQYALNVLEEETKHHELAIRRQIERMRERYADEVSSLRPIVEEKVKNLIAEREAEIAKIAKSSEKKVKAAAKEKEKYERRLEMLEQKMTLLQKKIGASKRRRDRSGSARWSYELKKQKREIDAIKSEIGAASRLIDHARREAQDFTKEAEQRCRRIVEQEEAKIRDMAALADSEIVERQRELGELLLRSSNIAKLIGRLIERKKLQASRIEEEATIPWKQDEIKLLHLPLYLVRYEREAEVRYRGYPPMVAMDYKGVLRTIQKAIWGFSLESRISLLLRPRSEELNEMLSSALIGRIQEDKVFEAKLLDICHLANLFDSKDFKEALTRGIGELEGEGWVSSEETQAIISEYGGI